MDKWLIHGQPGHPQTGDQGAHDTGPDEHGIPSYGNGTTLGAVPSQPSGVDGAPGHGTGPGHRAVAPRYRPAGAPGNDHDPHEVTVQFDAVRVGGDRSLRPAEAAPEPHDEQNAPVFVDASGRRSRRFRRLGTLLGVACAVYSVVIVATVLTGNSSAPWIPVPEQKQAVPVAPSEATPSPTGSATPSDTPTPGPSETERRTVTPARTSGPSASTGAASTPAPSASTTTTPPRTPATSTRPGSSTAPTPSASTPAPSGTPTPAPTSAEPTETATPETTTSPADGEPLTLHSGRRLPAGSEHSVPSSENVL
ncbi:hypothetical protein [Streptomyces sp. NPDC088757]|uniref:hypothetical protein n=1 Tax=Streptomyces sp. NPDC088757 TaxID=3365889 RepID=UPI0037FD6399